MSQLKTRVGIWVLVPQLAQRNLGQGGVPVLRHS